MANASRVPVELAADQRREKSKEANVLEKAGVLAALFHCRL